MNGRPISRVSSSKKFAVVRNLLVVLSAWKSGAQGRQKDKGTKRNAPRETSRTREAVRARARAREPIFRGYLGSRGGPGLRGREGRINYYYNEFHITIGVVKLRMVRVDPGSWVVHVQHGVRLASALRAVTQG